MIRQSIPFIAPLLAILAAVMLADIGARYRRRRQRARRRRRNARIERNWWIATKFVRRITQRRLPDYRD